MRHFIPASCCSFFGGMREACEGAFGGLVGSASEHGGQFGNAATVATSVERFGVDGIGDHFDMGFEQPLLGLDQHLLVESDGGESGEGLDQRHDVRRRRADLAIGRASVDELNHADDLAEVSSRRLIGAKGISLPVAPPMAMPSTSLCMMTKQRSLPSSVSR